MFLYLLTNELLKKSKFGRNSRKTQKRKALETLVGVKWEADARSPLLLVPFDRTQVKF